MSRSQQRSDAATVMQRCMDVAATSPLCPLSSVFCYLSKNPYHESKIYRSGGLIQGEGST